ncbi:STAS domain-containing protein [Actinopolymorpha sp. B9G3]|uniref:STAS domain-containing protein n=1 Tax=Actinopolymorpha sp. B9G3 TaxID=3158970 RepID=UPI0032D90F94
MPSRDGLYLAGDIDRSALEELRRCLASLGQVKGDVHLHLGDVTFIDVAGATEIARLASHLGPDDGLVLHDPPDELRRVLDLMFGVPKNIRVVSS